MEKLRTKYQAHLDKIIASKDPSLKDILNISISEIVNLNERMIEQNESLKNTERGNQMRLALNGVIEDARKAEAAQLKAIQMKLDSHTTYNNRFTNIGIGAVLGIALSIVTFAILHNSQAIHIAYGSDVQRHKNFDQRFLKDQHLVPIADGYLKKIVQSIKTLQVKDPNKLEAIAGKNFASLAEIDPTLQQARPPQLAKHFNVLIKADKTGYKVLMNWPLCPAVKLTRPTLVDPMRNANGLGCSHFGYWNKAGEKF